MRNNVRNFGAVGDGTVHLLSEKYSTLADAQSDYPRATSLSETLDWHGHQKTIDTALADGGGTVFTPRGRFIMRGPSALTFPLYNNNQNLPSPTPSSAQINWLGDGQNVSVCYWDTDKGSAPNDNYAIMFGPVPGDPNNQANSRYSSQGRSWGFVQDITFTGPSTTTTLDATGCNMSGICWAAGRTLIRVKVANFYAGIDIVGDHTPLIHIAVQACYFGLYINHNSPNLYGDLSISEKSSINNCRKAAIGFHYGGTMNNYHFTGRVFIGESPYCFFKEATPLVGGVPSLPTGYTEASNFLAGNQFDSVFLEGVGNACIWDDNLVVNGAARSTLDKIVFQNVTFPGWNDAKKIAGSDRCVIQVGTMNGCRFSNITKWEATGCTRPVFEVSVNAFGESLFEGNIETLLTSAATNGVMPFKAPSDLTAPLFAFNHMNGDGSCGPWKGRMFTVYNGFTVNTNQLVGTQYNGAKAIKDTDVTSIPLGIARTNAFPNNPAIASPVSFVVVAEEGVDVPMTAVAPNSIQTLKKLSTTAGSLTDSTSAIADGRVLGYTGLSNRLTFTKGIRNC